MSSKNDCKDFGNVQIVCRFLKFKTEWLFFQGQEL